ncbi:LIC12162 family protein, partial [bacterium]|nr:LIC12162 family protein [bacterium]
IQVLYDRYQSILTAVECRSVTNTLIGKYAEGQWLPQDYREFRKWYVNDDYNQYLYSRIIEYTNRIPFDILEVKKNGKASTKRVNSKKYSFPHKELLKRLIKLYEKFAPDCFNRIVLVSSYLNVWDLIKLQLSLRQFPYLFPPNVISPESNIDWDLREKLSYKSSGNEFEQLLSKMIKEQIPSIYVEGYAQAHQNSLNAYPQKPKVIFTAVAYHANEDFKLWAAYHVAHGVKLAGVQHGGLYGMDLWSSDEDHEIRICDQFYTWGWKSEACKNTKPLSAAQLNTIKRNAHPKKDGRLLTVLSTMPRYSYHMYSTYVASSGTLAYFNDQYRFVRTLSKKNQKLLLVRLYQHDWGWSQMERWSREFPEIECHLGNRSILEQLNK